MKTKTICAALLCALLCLVSCSRQTAPAGDSQEIPFQVAQRYFFKQGQPLPENPKIISREAFDRLFGMAAVMGPDGRPTAIDFEKQFAVAVVWQVTDRSTEIEPISVTRVGDKLQYRYRVTEGEPQSFQMQPLSIILIDRQYVDLPVDLLQTK